MKDLKLERLDQNKLLKYEEAEEFLGISVRQLRRFTKRKKKRLVVTVLGPQTKRIMVRDLKRFLEKLKV